MKINNFEAKASQENKRNLDMRYDEIQALINKKRKDLEI